MNNEISKNEVKRFNALAWLLAAEYIIMVLSPLPLIKYLGWVGGAIWAAITAVSLFTAVKVEKLKKANDLTTYKEIKAYMEGKSLDEISAERIKKGSKNLMKALFGAVSAMIGFTVCILVAWLLK